MTCKALTSHRQPVPSEWRQIAVPLKYCRVPLLMSLPLLIEYCALAFQPAPSALGLSRRPRHGAMLCVVLKRRRRPPRRVAVALSQLVSGIRFAEGIHLLGTVWACRVYAELLCKAPSQPD